MSTQKTGYRGTGRSGWRAGFALLLLLAASASWGLAANAPGGAVATAAPTAAARLPQLIELGSGKCIPCKQMKPILEELTRDYAGQLKVVTIDVGENPAAAKSYQVRLIPTQVFLAADGRELYRHEGFFAKKDIVAKWQELGVALRAPATPAAR